MHGFNSIALTVLRQSGYTNVMTHILCMLVMQLCSITEEEDAVMAEYQSPPREAPTGLLGSSRVSILPEVSELVPSLMFQIYAADCLLG